METSSLLHSEAMVGLLPGAETSSGLGHLPLGVFSSHDTTGDVQFKDTKLGEKQQKTQKNKRRQSSLADDLRLKFYYSCFFDVFLLVPRTERQSDMYNDCWTSKA